jgi:hypothetical protein
MNNISYKCLESDAKAVVECTGKCGSHNIKSPSISTSDETTLSLSARKVRRTYICVKVLVWLLRDYATGEGIAVAPHLLLRNRCVGIDFPVPKHPPYALRVCEFLCVSPLSEEGIVCRECGRDGPLSCVSLVKVQAGVSD